MASPAHLLTEGHANAVKVAMISPYLKVCL